VDGHRLCAFVCLSGVAGVDAAESQDCDAGESGSGSHGSFLIELRSGRLYPAVWTGSGAKVSRIELGIPLFLADFSLI
jgi:hypothetical protein